MTNANMFIIDKYIYFASEFIINLQHLHGSTEDSLDFIFNTIDDIMLNGEFKKCNILLDIIQIEKHSIDILIGILTITLPWKEKLTSRQRFFENISNYIKDLNYIENDILNGLE